jgi:hypothetical protein
MPNDKNGLTVRSITVRPLTTVITLVCPTPMRELEPAAAIMANTELKVEIIRQISLAARQ